MVKKRVWLVPGLMAAALLAVAGGCASSDPAGGDGDAAALDGGQADLGVQQDAPPFFQDTAPRPDGYQEDGGQDDAAVVGDGGAQLDGGTTSLDAGTCYPETDEALGGDTCADAVDKGTVSDLTSNHVLLTGNLWPGGDVDWYTITFVDSPDDAQACDKFKAKLSFTANGNPGGVFAFDVLLGDCQTSPVCGTAGDKNTGITVFEWDDSGECPCNADPVNTIPDVQVCVDHSMVLKVRVFRVSGSPACVNYELALDNG